MPTRKKVSIPVETWHKLRRIAAETNEQMMQVLTRLIEAEWQAHKAHELPEVYRPVARLLDAPEV
jgi:hypothetical protein